MRCGAVRFASPPFPPTRFELRTSRLKVERTYHSANGAPQSSKVHWPILSHSGAARTARNDRSLYDIMRGLFKDSGSLSVDKFVQRAQQLSNVRQLELMGDGELTLRTLR